MTHLKLIWSRLVSVQQYWINTGPLFIAFSHDFALRPPLPDRQTAQGRSRADHRKVQNRGMKEHT